MMQDSSCSGTFWCRFLRAYCQKRKFDAGFFVLWHILMPLFTCSGVFWCRILRAFKYIMNKFYYLLNIYAEQILYFLLRLDDLLNSFFSWILFVNLFSFMVYIYLIILRFLSIFLFWCRILRALAHFDAGFFVLLRKMMLHFSCYNKFWCHFLRAFM